MEYPKRRRSTQGVTGNRAVDISVLVDKVLKSTHISEDIHFKAISEHFAKIVGNAVAPYVKLEKLDKQTLVLKAVNSAWKQELFLQKNAIIERCNLLLGKPVVRDVRFV